jgi:Flp pilus assembly protein TadD
LITGLRGCLVCLTTLALGCSSGAEFHDGIGFSPDVVLAGAALSRVEDAPALVDDREVLAVSPEMHDFLKTNVHRKASGQVRLQELVEAIVGAREFGLQFDESTRTAAETFRQRRGNCLSFSNLFIAMAREVGLEANFQEVDIPPDWTVRNGTFVFNRHINVTVELGAAGTQAVDFNIGDFRSSYDRRTISDSRALAHFFNNLGVERMQAADSAAALAYFRKAIEENDRQFSPAWANLGTLFLRGGNLDYAEAAYLQALRVSGDDEVAMSNLVNLYELRGDAARAAVYRDRVVRHRNRNPYFHYYLARNEFAGQDYDAAIKHLKLAVRKKKNEDRFYFLLGMSYLQQGDKRAARRWLARAERVGGSEAEKREYRNTIDASLEAP